MDVCEHILVVCEATPEGDEALITAASLARRCGSRLTLLAVAETDPPAARHCCGGGSGAWDRLECDDARSRVERGALMVTGGPEPDLAVVEGRPGVAPAIIAEERGCDLIVVPAASPRRLARLTRRDWAAKLRRRASVPVLQTPPGARRRRAGAAATSA
ncbi:MAG: universal stress protein [Solirubrobacteraceae bacterium]